MFVLNLLLVPAFPVLIAMPNCFIIGLRLAPFATIQFLVCPVCFRSAHRSFGSTHYSLLLLNAILECAKRVPLFLTSPSR
jgi:hypothetical protein